MISVASSRYARALLDVVFDPRSGLDANRVAGQLRAVESLVKGSAELRHALLSPAVPNSRKRAVMSKFAPELGLDTKVLNFCYILVDHRRIGQITEIRESFQNALDERLGFLCAGVTSAEGLSDPQRDALQAKLAKLTGKQIRMEYSVDPALIGGVVARIGSTVYDGSVRGELAALRHRLVTES